MSGETPTGSVPMTLRVVPEHLHELVARGWLTADQYERMRDSTLPVDYTMRVHDDRLVIEIRLRTKSASPDEATYGDGSTRREGIA